jgi:hypothetical protein
MKKCAPIFTVFFLLVFSYFAVGKTNLVEILNDGQVIDWGKSFVSADGKGEFPKEIASTAQSRLVAKKFALAEARNNLREALGEIRITEQLPLKDLLAKNEVLSAKFESVLKDYKIINEKEENYSFRVLIGINFYGETGFASMILPLIIKDLISSEQVFSSQENKPLAAEYTGLIIDASGLDFKPVLFPSIFEEKGSLVFRGAKTENEFVINQGVCDYFSSLENAVKTGRAGRNPLVVKANNLSDKGNLVLSTKDAKYILSGDITSKFLENYRLIIVY